MIGYAYREAVQPFGTASTATDANALEIDPGWQIIAVPQRYGYWDAGTHAMVLDTTPSTIMNTVIAQVEDLYGPGLIEICQAKPGGSTVYLSYRDGFTLETYPGNFALMVSDTGGILEATAFLCKSVSGVPFQIEYWETR